MLENTKVKILGDSHTNTPIKIIECDLQDHTNSIDSYKCTKLLFIDYIEPIIDEGFYLDIDDKIYKIIRIDTYSEHEEVYLFYCNLKDVKVNSVDKKVLIEEITDKISVLDEKIIVSDFIISQCDLIEYQARQWLVISEISNVGYSYISRIRKCRELKYNNKIIYGLVDSKVFDIDENKYFNLVDNQILITIGDINKVVVNDIINFNNKAYIVIGVNDTIENTLILRCSYDMENTHTYTISLSVNNADIEKSKAFQIVSTCMDNSEVITSPVLTYISSDETIAIVDNTGLISTLNVGTATITVQYQNVESILNINVTDIPVVMSYMIVSSVTGTNYTTINNNSTRSQFVVNNDMTVPTDKIFTFTLEQSDLNPTITTSQLITKVEVLSSTSVKLTGSSVKGSFYLVATCGDIIVKNLLREKATMDL